MFKPLSGVSVVFAILLGGSICGCASNDVPTVDGSTASGGDFDASTPEYPAPSVVSRPDASTDNIIDAGSHAAPVLVDGGNATVDTSSESEPDRGCNAGTLVVRQGSIQFDRACWAASLRLLPRVQIDNQWYGSGADGPCSVTSNSIRCPAKDLGIAWANIDRNTIQLGFDAKRKVTVRAASVEGTLDLAGAAAWLSNGYQSFSQSGILSLGNPPSDKDFNNALNADGDSEVYRTGRELSWWFSYVGGGPVSLFAGATTANRFRSYVQVYRAAGDSLTVRLVSGSKEQVNVDAGRTLDSESWRLELGEDLHRILSRYGHAVPSRRTTHPRPAPYGWNSWYAKWSAVHQNDLLSKTDARSPDIAKQTLEPFIPSGMPPMRVVVDDGWERAQGDWFHNEKFALGMDQIAKELDQKNMRLGIWIAPFILLPDTDVARNHPEWLVPDRTYAQSVGEPWRILDVTHPGAADYLRSTIKKIISWGADYIKVDFLSAGTFEGRRTEQITGIEAYHRGMQIIREAAGDTTFLMGCGAPVFPTLQYTDGWRAGNDIGFAPYMGVLAPLSRWSFVANQARQFTSRWPLCLATLCDTEPPLLKSLNRQEVESSLFVAASGGGAFFYSDDLPTLASDRLAWGLDAALVKQALGGIPATPESFYPDTIPDVLKNMKDGYFVFDVPHEIPSIWRLADGRRIGINFTAKSKTYDGVEVPSHATRLLPSH